MILQEFFHYSTRELDSQKTIAITLTEPDEQFTEDVIAKLQFINFFWIKPKYLKYRFLYQV